MMADYRPIARNYQQLVPWTPTGGFDCSPETGAWLADAHTLGKLRLNGQIIRRFSNEPTPDPASPGLNFPQVDTAVFRASDAYSDRIVNLQLGVDGTRAKAAASTVRQGVINGQPTGWQMNRGALIDRLPAAHIIRANPFRGGHAGGLITINGLLYGYDPLIPEYFRLDWDDVFYAASRLWTGSAYLGQGWMNVLRARDIIPSSYQVSFAAGGQWSAYKVVDGVITRIRAASTDTPVVRRCARRTVLRFPAHDKVVNGVVVRAYRNVARLLEGELVRLGYPYVNLDDTDLTYRENLP
jgi:hypothetical protein